MMTSLLAKNEYSRLSGPTTVTPTAALPSKLICFEMVDDTIVTFGCTPL
jgi:hypothetical protein